MPTSPQPAIARMTPQTNRNLTSLTIVRPRVPPSTTRTPSRLVPVELGATVAPYAPTTRPFQAFEVCVPVEHSRLPSRIGPTAADDVTPDRTGPRDEAIVAGRASL